MFVKESVVYQFSYQRVDFRGICCPERCSYVSSRLQSADMTYAYICAK